MSITTIDFYSLFPLQDAGWDTMWTGLVAEVYSMLTNRAHSRWTLYSDGTESQEDSAPGAGVPFLRVLGSSQQATAAVRGTPRLLYDDYNRWCGADDGLFLTVRGSGSLTGAVAGLSLGSSSGGDGGGTPVPLQRPPKLNHRQKNLR